MDAYADRGGSGCTAVIAASTVITLNPPLLLFITMHRCWKCGGMQEVIALGSDSLTDDDYDSGGSGEIKECVLLSEIEVMPEAIDEYLRQHFPLYRLHYSQTAEMSYYANICECGANFGDHFLFSEPGGAFFRRRMPTLRK